MSEHKKVVAIGEIGLDYYYDTHPKELQRFWFRQQLRLAEETNLPVIIHSRDASQETFDIIKASSVRRGSIHCYSGSAQMALDWRRGDVLQCKKAGGNRCGNPYGKHPH